MHIRTLIAGSLEKYTSEFVAEKQNSRLFGTGRLINIDRFAEHTAQGGLRPHTGFLVLITRPWPRVHYIIRPTPSRRSWMIYARRSLTFCFHGPHTCGRHEASARSGAG